MHDKRWDEEAAFPTCVPSFVSHSDSTRQYFIKLMTFLSAVPLSLPSEEQLRPIQRLQSASPAEGSLVTSPDHLTRQKQSKLFSPVWARSIEDFTSMDIPDRPMIYTDDFWLTASVSGRAYPDVAAQGNGFQVVIGGRVSSVGGTSASSPVCYS